MIKIQSVSFQILFLVDCIQGFGSGFYVDDGNSQTLFDRNLSQADKLIVEEQILKLLGLPDRPHGNTTHKMDGVLRKAAPKFLLNAYHHLLDEDDDETMVHPRVRRSIGQQKHELTEFDEYAIDESDLIMTFVSQHHAFPEYRHQREKTLWFNISEIKPDSRLIAAELRIYINCTVNMEKFRLAVYLLETNTKQFLTNADITSEHNGWIELNITRALFIWMTNKNSNHGLLITTNSGKKFSQIGILMDDRNEYQPFIVGFFHTGGISHNQPPPRIKRNASQNNKKATKSSSTSSKQPTSSQKNILTMGHHQNFQQHKSCQRQTLFVSFKDLKWSDWIIAPIGFHAFYCSGECNFPLNSPTNPTNHAIVQTLVHSKHPTKVPKPCCVPTRLGHISVLYYLDETNVNLQKYKNIVVRSCGCH